MVYVQDLEWIQYQSSGKKLRNTHDPIYDGEAGVEKELNMLFGLFIQNNKKKMTIKSNSEKFNNSTCIFSA